MARLFYHVMQDNLGNLLFDVAGTMRIAGTGTLATIYGDAALTIPLPNPMTNHPSYGSFKCYLGVGAYDFYMAKAGYSFETLTGLEGWGTMALQNANNVAITGGSITALTQLTSAGPLLANGTATFNADTRMPFSATIGNGGPIPSVFLSIHYLKASTYGLSIHPSDGDAGGAQPVSFLNAAAAIIGSISTTGSATAYNTSSDARLKDEVTPLSGALDVIRALNPVAFVWKADGSPGRGLLAQEVAEVVDGVITGERDALDEDGGIIPQMIDYSKLVPYLVAAVKELTQQVEQLQAQLQAASA